MSFIDLRSDTVTQPTESMCQAMAKAEVGDDVYEEDPTVIRLEECAAEMLGKDAGLFVPTGTMGNLLALLSHTRPGDEVLLEADCHIYYYEVGGLGMLAGLTPRLISGTNGTISAAQLQRALRLENIHFPSASLLCLENTHNRSGGRVVPQQDIEDVAKLAKAHNLKLHLDGARLFNAATASAQSASCLAGPFDSVMVCLSKGLAAPVGSVLVGDKAFITKARKFRKMVGGGMRQAGVLAAAGLLSLQVMTQRLAEDHHNAQRLAEGLGNISGLSVANKVETNMVVLEVNSQSKLTANQLISAWQQEGVKALTVSENTIRLVTHYQITASDVDKVVSVTNRLIA